MTPVPAGFIYDEGKTGNVVAEAMECFKNDMTKCLSYTGCGAKANDPTKYDESQGNTPLTTCCMAKAKCGAGYSCPAGTRQIANTQDKVCQGGNCASTECCADDPTKCKGASVTCDASTYKDPTKDGNEAGADDAAKKKTTAALKQLLALLGLPQLTVRMELPRSTSGSYPFSQRLLWQCR